MVQPVFIVDDDAAVRDSLRMLLESAGYTVRGHNSAQSFLSEENLSEAARDGSCLIADIRMPGMSGLELQEELARRNITLPVIIITGHGDVPLAVRAMMTGAVDFIEKPFDDHRMLDSIARALQIRRQKKNQADETQAARDRLSCLTRREREVMDQLVKGHPNKIVAHALGISPRTVEIHRAHLMGKLQVRHLSDIVRMALAADEH